MSMSVEEFNALSEEITNEQKGLERMIDRGDVSPTDVGMALFNITTVMQKILLHLFVTSDQAERL